MRDEGDDRGPIDTDSIEHFRQSGLLMLVNMAVLWPRGYALRVHYEDDGGVAGMDLADFGEYMAGFGPGATERELAEQIMNNLINHELNREQQFVEGA